MQLRQTLLDAVTAAMSGCPFFEWIIDRYLRFVSRPEEVPDNAVVLGKWAKSSIRLNIAWDRESKLDVVAVEINVLGYRAGTTHLERFNLRSRFGKNLLAALSSMSNTESFLR